MVTTETNPASQILDKGKDTEARKARAAKIAAAAAKKADPTGVLADDAEQKDRERRDRKNAADRERRARKKRDAESAAALAADPGGMLGTSKPKATKKPKTKAKAKATKPKAKPKASPAATPTLHSNAVAVVRDIKAIRRKLDLAIIAQSNAKDAHDKCKATTKALRAQLDAVEIDIATGQGNLYSGDAGAENVTPPTP